MNFEIASYSKFKKNIILTVVIAIIYTLGYLFINHFPIFEPVYLPLFHIENQIPLIPWTTILYVSDYFFLPAIILIIRDKDMKPFIQAFVILVLIHFAIFLLYPTIYPRENWLIHGNTLTDYMLIFVRKVDSPLNCFPSAHIGICFLGVFFIKKIKKSSFPIFLFWAILIALSTLTTKQHYFLDVIGGIVVAAISYALIFSFNLNRSLAIIYKRFNNFF